MGCYSNRETFWFRGTISSNPSIEHFPAWHRENSKCHVYQTFPVVSPYNQHGHSGPHLMGDDGLQKDTFIIPVEFNVFFIINYYSVERYAARYVKRAFCYLCLRAQKGPKLKE